MPPLFVTPSGKCPLTICASLQSNVYSFNNNLMSTLLRAERYRWMDPLTVSSCGPVSAPAPSAPAPSAPAPRTRREPGSARREPGSARREPRSARNQSDLRHPSHPTRVRAWSQCHNTQQPVGSMPSSCVCFTAKECARSCCAHHVHGQKGTPYLVC
jgi:hypothetical protein